jgi:5-formyltetrahydrofolate cyclo-ligase
MQEKSVLRKHMQKSRDTFLATSDPEELNAGILLNFQKVFASLSENFIIAGYFPVDSEADGRACLTYCHQKHYTCCLPVIEKGNLLLTFRKWQPKQEMISGTFNIPVPSEEQPTLLPTLLLVPLLAFDQQGHRLGRGMGHYDYTIADLRKKHSIITIGLAYDCQEIDNLPVDDHDQPLDYVVTPTRNLRFKK